MPPLTSSNAVTITNPLVLYRTHLATKRIAPDPAQHRLALHLQNLYQRLKDYQPDVDYRHRLDDLTKVVPKLPVDNAKSKDDDTQSSVGHRSLLSSLRWKKETAAVTALTKRLTDHESAMQLQSPQGLLLYGEVGTGKSLLIDLLADCLPNRKKKRWHFNTFMLETFAKLEQFRRSTVVGSQIQEASGGQHSLLWLARDMISTSPILFLDEFQLPDKATSKILTNLFTSFFHLGGVLIATSNRMPQELASASGIEFTAPSTPGLNRFGSLIRAFGANNAVSGNSSMSAGKSDFAAFLEVLRARCEIWEMEGAKDWRRHDTQKDSDLDIQNEARKSDSSLTMVTSFRPIDTQDSTKEPTKLEGSNEHGIPQYYFLNTLSTTDTGDSVTADENMKAAELRSVNMSAGSSMSDIQVPWKSTNLRVYGRNLTVPLHFAGVTKWNCKSSDSVEFFILFQQVIQHDSP